MRTTSCACLVIGALTGCLGCAPAQNAPEDPPASQAPAAPAADAASPQTPSEEAAMQAMDAFMAAFNSRDPQAWAATLNYPHVRFASATVRIYETPEEFAENMDFDAFAERYGWDHSAWDSQRIVQSGDEKVHIAVRFTRYDAEDKVLASYDSLYLVTLLDGHWGIQARSSFAP